MRIIPRYILKAYLLTFGITLVVFTFVICTMVLFKVSDFVAAGGDAWIVLRVFLGGLPSALSFSIPISVLTAALLTFGRLSAGGEITAMKACGISMRRIVSYPLVIAVLLAALCFYLNAEITPISYNMRRQAILALGVETPLEMLEEGRFVRDFPGISFFIGEKRGNRLDNIIIYQDRPDKPPRNIRAKSGVVRVNPDRTALIIDLVDVRIDPIDDEHPGIGEFKHSPFVIPLGNKSRTPRVKLEHASVAPGPAALRLTVTGPPNYVLDQGTVSEVLTTSDSSRARLSEGESQLRCTQPVFPLLIPFKGTPGKTTLSMHLNLQYVRTIPPRVLFSKEIDLRLPLIITPDATNSIVPVSYLVSQDKKRSDMTLGELQEEIRILRTLPQQAASPVLDRQRMSLIVEFHKRIVLALSCVAFVLLGVPLATKTHRSESTIGVAMSLLLMTGFYLFVIVADSLTAHPATKPYLIVWVPILLSLILGGYLIRRVE